MIMILLSSLGILLGLCVWRLMTALRRFRVKKSYTSAIEAPSVSVCIPARNETHAMTQCLERVLASDYRKLEVIVYDDTSGDDTSVLIKSFAHAGVRFVAGDKLPNGWLGKNYALDVLSREASGTYVVFMDVDTDIAPTTISQLISYMMTENLVMASVIPGRRDVWRTSVLFGHLRYFWQLLLSRSHTPATSSSLWLMKRHVLLDTVGGFAPHKNQVQPESYIAALIGTHGYHCLVSSSTLGVHYEKKWRSQVETSRRLLYPMMGGNWWGALVGLIILGALNTPLVVVVVGVLWGWSPVHTAWLMMLLAYGLLYSVYTHAVWRSWWGLGVMVWPLVILQELVLAVYSIVGYARHTITWKGRLVQAPATATPAVVPDVTV